MSSGGGGTTIVQPSYGDSLREALEAQTALLTGTQVGETDFSMFNEIGGLEGLVNTYERPLRMTSAQVDTDVLRQTLLGNRAPVYADEQTTAQTTAQTPAQTTAQTTQPTEETTGEITPNPMKAGSLVPNTTPGMPVGTTTATPYGVGTIEPSGQVKLIQPYSDEQYSAIFQATQKAQTSEGSPQRRATQTNVDYGGQVDPNTGKIVTGYSDEYKDPKVAQLINGLKPGPGNDAHNLRLINANKDWLGEQNTTDLAGKVILGQTGDLVKTVRDLYPDGLDRVPIYKKDTDGNDIVVPLDADGNPITQADESTTVNIPGQGEQTLPGLPPGLENPTPTPTPAPTPTREVVGYKRAGDGLIDLLGDRRMAIDPTTGLPSERISGFSEDDEFLGLAALAEDIQRGNLSRQREADLADVERLSGRFQNIMEDYKPGTVTGIQGARDLLEEQKEAMTTGGGAITVPSTDTYGGDIAGQTMTAATVADPLALEASTSYDPSASVSGGTFDRATGYTAAQVADPMALTAATSYKPSAGVKGEGYTATAGLTGGNIGQDAFRQALMAQATDALDNGLSDRELANISNAARARSTMMGRTFDQKGAIDESKALVLEDQNRRMQNRAFAQQALGQEADFRERDLGRGLQASMQNQAALNRAAEFGASQGMQAQLANQAANNQALSQGLTAGLSQEALAAQQQQAKAMADATATNRASEFGVSAGMQQQAQANQAGLQAQLANQQATNQAAQFGVGAGMEQDALRAQLGQQASLAQAQMDQQANAFDADSAQRAATVNQGQAQQAAQFGVGATMDAQRLNEQLRQQGLGNYINAVGNLAQIEDQTTLDPFQAILGRASGGSLQAGQGVFGQAGYGLQSGPQYLNPEAGLGYISNQYTNMANMYAADVAADATRDAGLMNMIGSIGGAGVGAAFCWVAREVYGPANPAWLQFREWMFTESPNWFFKLYAEYGERFANWISDKPRIKSIIRKWMDSKIGGK